MGSTNGRSGEGCSSGVKGSWWASIYRVQGEVSEKVI
jgi:hypothetical protein